MRQRKEEEEENNRMRQRERERGRVRETEKDREQEKPHKTIFLPGERNSVMKKEGGPWARGPLIKLSEKGAREGAKEREGRSDGGRERE